jgi:hypothetical protein
MRFIVAGTVGAIALFVWTSIAHMATPLAEAGIAKIENEKPVLDAMKQGVGPKAGMYFFPWVDPKDPKMMEKTAVLMKTKPSGILIYAPPGVSADITPMLIGEFVKELVQALVAAFLLSLTALTGYFARAGFVAALGVFAALGQDVSYYIWYGFPLSYTLGQIAIGVIGAAVMGLAIAALLKPNRKSKFA